MKKLAASIAGILICLSISAQVETSFFPERNAFEHISIIKNHSKPKIIKELTSFDVQKIIDSEKTTDYEDVPFRFGKEFDVNLSLIDGTWADLDSDRIWSMGFYSKGAYSINFVFDKFHLSDGAQLYIINANGSMLYGPVTSKQTTGDGLFLTDLIQGDNVFVYLFEPKNEKGNSTLIIKRVVHAYKNLYPELNGIQPSLLSCHNNIACYPDYSVESDAVALVLLSSGTEHCSGSLVMTADKSFKPYFLTAFHCIDANKDGLLTTTEISDANNWMFKFRYKTPTCSGSSIYTSVTYNRANLRAAEVESDFALMELANPLVGSGLTWLGWDRSLDIPTSGSCIHHPDGNVMKISFANNGFSTNGSPIGWEGGVYSPANTHWAVPFTSGTTEGGSSGGPLLNQNKKIVGQLHGGGSTGCAPITKYFGRFYTSWTGGGTNTTRLSNWLDPCGSGTMTTNTSRPPYVSGLSLVCASYDGSFTVNNLPSGATITWLCSTEVLQQTSAQGSNPCYFRAIGSGNAWVQAVISNGCSQYTTPQAVCSAGSPTILYVSGPTTVQPGTSYTYQAVKDVWNYNATYYWSLSPSGNVSSSNESFTSVSFPGSGHYTLTAEACNPCGCSDDHSLGIDVYGTYYLALSPNPSSGETTVSLGSTSEENIDDNLEWNLEVYDQGQQLKTGKTKLKGKEFKLNTSGWKEGVYIVRASFKGEVLTEKLVVGKQH